jgi:riboflavin biosynthesis pyrimidine reductase
VPTIVVTSHAGRRAAQHLGRHGVQVVDAEDLAGGLRALRALGVGSVLVEGGSTLVAEMLACDLVDRVYSVQAPLWLGAGTPAFGPRAAVPLAQAAPWVVTERRALGRDTLLVVDRALCLQES